jgi:hypothetical protein
MVPLHAKKRKVASSEQPRNSLSGFNPKSRKPKRERFSGRKQNTPKEKEKRYED